MVFGKKNDLGRIGNRSRGKFGARGLILLAVLLLAAFFGYRKYISHQLAKANHLLAEGRLEEAEQAFNKAMKLPGSGRAGQDGLGAVALLAGREDAATQHFSAVVARKSARFGADPAVVFSQLNDMGRYDGASRYRDFLQEWKAAKDLRPYALEFAVVSLGQSKLDEARAYLDDAPPSVTESQRYHRLDQLLREYAREGLVAVIVDRAGEPILNYFFATGRYDFAMPRLFSGWQDEAGDITLLSKNDELKRYNRIHTTLDIALQKASYQAMKGYQGTLILTAVDSGDILAAYGTPGYDPFNFLFEPGSVIKLLTYGFFLQGGGDVSPYAPKNYPGNRQIGGKIFYDWTTQGQLETVEEGMAVSCNLMFAQMGLDLSWPGLSNGLNRLFDGQPKAGYLGEGVYGQLLREPENAWELGRVAIGLDLLRTSALGISLIPMAVAAGGTLPKPRLVREYANLEGGVYRKQKTESLGRLFSAEVADKLRDAMVAAVRFERGTARRAEVPFVNAGMKTGTAGERPFDSVMVGFFPAENPKVAFSFVLHKGGKCEINGARVAKRLQEQIQALAPDYLK